MHAVKLSILQHTFDSEVLCFIQSSTSSVLQKMGQWGKTLRGAGTLPSMEGANIQGG